MTPRGERTAKAIEELRARRGRLVAVGTTVVRALEHAAVRDGTVHPGRGLATQRIDASTRECARTVDFHRRWRYDLFDHTLNRRIRDCHREGTSCDLELSTQTAGGSRRDAG